MERQIQEIVARRVGIMVYYHNCERCETSSRRMADEVRDVGVESLGLGMSPDGVESSLIGPLSAELVARYGHELGPRLHAEFLAAFEEEATRTSGDRAAV